MRLGIDGFDGSQAMTDEDNRMVPTTFEQLDPRGHIVPAIVNSFVRRPESASHISQAGAKDRIVPARVNRERRDSQLLKLGNQRLKRAGRVEVAGDTVKQNRRGYGGGRQSLACASGWCECPVEPQAIARDSADKFDVHRKWGRHSCLPELIGRQECLPHELRILSRSRRRRGVLLGTQAGDHVKHAAQVGHPRAEAIDELLEHELAVHHRLVTVSRFFGELVNIVVLHLDQRLAGNAAASSQIGI